MGGKLIMAKLRFLLRSFLNNSGCNTGGFYTDGGKWPSPKRSKPAAQGGIAIKTCTTRACAHRGDNYCAPENTLPAFELAIAKGAHQIEFDLRVTRDGQLILMHDETVDRTTSGTGRTVDLTFDELRRLDAGSYKSPEYAGTPVPTFREVLGIVPPGVLVNCHVPQVIAQIQEFDLLDQCFLACGAAHIAAARQVEPRIMICNLEGQRSADSDYPEATVRAGAQFIQIWGWAQCLPEVVQYLHEHGVTVNFFGTSDAQMMHRLIAAGVDYVLTDHLDLMLEVIAQYDNAP